MASVNGYWKKNTYNCVCLFCLFCLFCFTHISSYHHSHIIIIIIIIIITYLLAAAGAGFFLGGGHPTNSRAAVDAVLRLVEGDGGRARK